MQTVHLTESQAEAVLIDPIEGGGDKRRDQKIRRMMEEEKKEEGGDLRVIRLLIGK